jgi:hypothetical protein
LFDLRTDPDQLRNLAEKPEYANVLRRLRDRCDALIEENKCRSRNGNR